MQNKISPQLVNLAKTIVEDLKNNHEHKDWKQYGQKPCLQYKMQMGDGMATKSVSIINFPINQIAEFLKADGSLSKINTTCIEDKKLVKDGDIHVTYLRYKAPWPVSDRDFVNISYSFCQSPTIIYIGTKSCNYPYAEVNKVVRGQVLIGGYILQAIDQKTTRVTYIACVDIKGSLPGMVKNQLAKKQGELSSKIQPLIKANKK